MLDYFQRSLRNKLLVVFIAIGFLPFITLLVYTIFLSESRIVDKTVVEQLERTQSVLKLINNHLTSLSKEVNFISSLDLMDDLLADDIDKRVSRLLTQKASDFNLDVKLMTVNEKGFITASSHTDNLLQKFNMQQLSSHHGKYIEGKNLYVYASIQTSFDESKELGYLVLEYNLDNLDVYLTHQESIHSYIINSKSFLTIGENLPFHLNFIKDEHSVINSEHVIVYKQISSFMQDWYIVYAVNKSVAFAFLYDFIRFMLYVSVFIFAFIIYVSIRYSKGIVKPIEELTAITNEITKTQNYSAKLDINSKDEIATLTHSFNKMIRTTSIALETLEEENRLRLKRFTQLIDIFNTIIQTKNEDECVKVSMKEISKLTGKKDLYFIQEEHDTISGKKFTEIYVSDFENDTKVYFGSIALSIENLEDKNEKDFYNSIASMIALQLDKIRLIKRTLSASNAKSAFISNMSHELRTPLNAIIGFAQYMITYEELTDDQIDTVANIEKSAQYLLEMINEILDIAKIEAGKMEAHPEVVNMVVLVQNCYDMLNPLASDKNLDFEFHYDNFTNDNYISDPKMFQQIVLNLLSNAIKFTQKGKILLELTNDNKYIYIKVKDDGIGIAHENINALFNDFTQVENVMQKTHKGTGLGLSLSKKMANILDGDIELQSDGLGLGTTVIFKIVKKI
ncbi:MAG: HAMP domain-containing protein [Sulfurimonas sp.]|jgi:signal transduction histidine kinase/HAMP domain-containing protein|nr:HAMP domain-containing protein [Sulfurimonas sp.]MBU3937968.1 HAMP domain-containing protein [bacterium]MBU4024006.1 HAMP domain-containing protein [bacterium]MBU4057895.1 HAMP domain-containing protein [bacterium]MBU4110075.1 HAMP domain-containing protein [bacterium]